MTKPPGPSLLREASGGAETPREAAGTQGLCRGGGSARPGRHSSVRWGNEPGARPGHDPARRRRAAFTAGKPRPTERRETEGKGKGGSQSRERRPGTSGVSSGKQPAGSQPPGSSGLWDLPRDPPRSPWAPGAPRTGGSKPAGGEAAEQPRSNGSRETRGSSSDGARSPRSDVVPPPARAFLPFPPSPEPACPTIPRPLRAAQGRSRGPRPR